MLHYILFSTLSVKIYFLLTILIVFVFQCRFGAIVDIPR